MNRIEILKNEIEMDQNDPFNYYLLALEYLKTNDVFLAEEYFEVLLEKFATYLATYYTYASYLIEKGEDTKAEKIIKRGIEISILQTKSKTEKELKQLLEINF